MTASIAFLDRWLGPRHAVLWLHEVTHEFVVADMLDAATALAWVQARVTAGDPLILASPGQVWRLPDHLSPGGPSTPARCLYVHQRLTCPPAVVVDAFDDEDDGEGDEVRHTLPLDALGAYRLHSWEWDR